MNCSFGPKQSPEEIKQFSPGTTELVCELEIEEPGDFASQIHLFVDDQGTREIILSVRGIAKAPGK